jgi:excisionase family DNA binding protein
MDPLQPLINLIKEAVRSALETELPAQLRRYTLPSDPDKLYSYAEAAAYLGVTESAVKERVKAGELWTVELGKFRKVPQRAISEYVERERLRQQALASQAVPPSGVSDEVQALLRPTQTRRSRP